MRKILRVMRWTKHTIRLLAVCFIILLTANSCKDDNLDMFNPVLSANDEGRLGVALHQVIQANPGDFPVLSRNDYPEAYDYLDEVIRMIEVKTEIRDKFEWEIIMFDDDDTKNAFTLPGGKIYITTGFLKFIDSEHKLFSLVAHEAFYADRINQNSQGELSLAMQKLKESPKYGSLGTRIFLEVIAGNSEEGSEMVEFIMEQVYEPYEVIEADDFALNMICENYLYSGYGIKEMILEVEDTPSITTFQWFENKPPVPNTLISQGTSLTGPFRDERLDNIDMQAHPGSCGSENITLNKNEYAEFLDMLP